ncbi:MAG: NAD(P)/FAD-dependent oxidoreductase [Ignavibacteriales bacterium]|nr:NAD(P)/FAD-dependent oxidoreductase [Ignavibacteriales bacterium]
MTQTDVLVIGGGAAGLMCAIEAAKRGRKVRLLEHNREIGAKIRISGGGKCNFTNRSVSARNFISENRHFATSALSRYTPRDFLSFVEAHHIAYSEREHGQLFCRRSATEIIEALRVECRERGVKIETGISVGSIAKSLSFTVSTSQGDYVCDALVIATGGLSIRKLGASDFGLRIANQFVMKIVSPKPGLVPLVLGEKESASFGSLSGISTLGEVTCNGNSFTEAVLITHRGLSGPAVLQASSYWNAGESVNMNFFPGIDVIELLMKGMKPGKKLSSVLSSYLPSRLADVLERLAAPDTVLDRCNRSQIEALARRLTGFQLHPEETEGFEKAEVTVGGVDTAMLSSKTMESKLVPGLYFIGEVVDVTGWLGGYNFQWAWSSGWAAGQCC